MDYKRCAYCKKRFLINNEESVFCSSICREKRNKVRSEWIQKNKNHIKKHAHEKYLKNHTTIKENAKQYRKTHPEYMIEWRKNNKEYLKKYDKEYKKIHKNYINIHAKEHRSKPEIKEYRKRYMKGYMKGYKKNREQHDVLFKLENRLRHRIYLAIRNNHASLHTKQLLGCTIIEYKKYLENLFKPGMTWENWNFSGWHIDHIKPCDAHDLNNPEEQKKCFHYTNTQPLWATENLSKGKKQCLPGL